MSSPSDAVDADDDLAADAVCYRYPGADHDVIHNFSHRFAAGTLTALVAPSGAGKSTLLALLGLLLSPGEGAITVAGLRVGKGLRRSQVARLRTEMYGWILQTNPCFEARTALDNVAVALLASGISMADARAQASGALAAVGLADRTHLMARHLSGGEQQRMTIARALLADRPYLLADEPTGNLDRANSHMVFTALRACAHAGATVVVATHDLDSAATADYIIDLADSAYSVSSQETQS